MCNYDYIIYNAQFSSALQSVFSFDSFFDLLFSESHISTFWFGKSVLKAHTFFTLSTRIILTVGHRAPIILTGVMLRPSVLHALTCISRINEVTSLGKSQI